MSYCVLIPAYNPGETLIPYAEGLQAQGFSTVIVDDGSKNGKEIFDMLEARGFPVLHHSQNEGKGQALKTGFAYARENGFTGVITVSADCRYRIQDLLRIEKAMRSAPDKLILGVHDTPDAPLPLRMSNALVRFLFRLLYGLDLKAAQTGLRGIPFTPEIVQSLLAIPYTRYEFETEMLVESKTLFPGGIEQLAVQVQISEKGHYRPLADGASLLRVLLKVLPQFILSCLGAFLINYVLFNLLYYRVFHVSVPATVIATVVSTGVAYVINKKLVFRNAGKRFNVRNYFLLQATLLAISTGAMFLLTDVLQFPAAVMKIVVEYGLHLINFTVQNRLSSAPEKTQARKTA